MALRDWNNDGQKDFTDDFIEYHIFPNMAESFEKQSKEYNSKPKRSGSSAKFWVIFFIVYFICKLYSELS